MKTIEVFIPNETSLEEFTARIAGDTDEVEVIDVPICFLSPNDEWDCHKRVCIVIEEEPALECEFCVPCTCENKDQCQGCGAEDCADHRDTDVGGNDGR